MPPHKRKINALEKEGNVLAKKTHSISSFFNARNSTPEIVSEDAAAHDSAETEVQPVPEVLTQSTKPPLPLKTLSATPERKIAMAKHRQTGFNTEWTVNRPWLLKGEEENEEGMKMSVMYCSLCVKHNIKTKNRSEVWTSKGCRSLRLDKITGHENSDIHRSAIRLETQEQLGIKSSLEGSTSINQKEAKAVETSMKCLLFLIEHGIPHTTVFKDFINFAIEELDCPTLKHLNKGGNAQYTSHRSINEFITSMTEDIEETMTEQIMASPAYAVMTDETTDVSNRKHLAVVVTYVDQKDGEVCVDFYKDVEVDDGKAETIFKEVKSVVEELGAEKCAAFGSDGCNTMIGKKSGVSTRLKAIKPGLLAIHCQNHRLALAAKDSFEGIPAMQEADTHLNSLFKYYDRSAVRTKSLEKMQKLLEDSEIRKLKKAAHTRWLSHLDAVTSLRDCYSAVLVDLENAESSGSDRVRVGSGPSASGLLKNFKTFKMISLIHFLCDALKPVAQLALTFERNNIDLAVVQPRLHATLKILESLKCSTGLSGRKADKTLNELGVSPSDMEIASVKKIEHQFIGNLVENISSRIENSDVITCLGALCFSEDDAAFSGNDEVEQLAAHLSMDPDTVLEEWDTLKQTVSCVNAETSSPSALLKVISKLKSTTGVFCPSVERLCTIGAVLPVSTAEVERVFSEVNRTVTDFRKRLQVESMHQLLMINRNRRHLNICKAVRRWTGQKQRRIVS